MSLEAIIDKIRGEAAQKTEAILKTAEEAKDSALRKHAEKLSSRHEKDIEKTRTGIEEDRKRKEFHVRRDAARKIMNARRAMMDDAIEAAVRNLTSSSDADYLELISSLLEGCDLSGRIEVVTSGSDEHRITPEYLGRHSGADQEFVLSEKKHGETGGIIFKSGKISQNGTFPMIAELAHEDMVMLLSDLVPLEKN